MLNQPFFSGVPAVDEVSSGLHIGDNVVWRINEIRVYQEVCQALVVKTLAHEPQVPIVYFRFANHLPIFSEHPYIQEVKVNPEAGFENFITQIHEKISSRGRGGIYIFDSLSDLQETYYSDRMIGSFFRLTCPLLRRMETIAYFTLNWGVHSSQAVDPIRRTTQVWFDAYMHKGVRYLQAIKTRDGTGQAHHGILFRWTGGNSPAEPVRNSALESSVRVSANWSGLPSSPLRRLDVWDQVFMHFQSVTKQIDSFVCRDKKVPSNIAKEHDRLRRMVIRMILTNDPAMIELVFRYVPSSEILAIWRRMVGTGFIGGKAVGMILARDMLQHSQAKIVDYLEEHDSFYIGSDVFYTYLVNNDCWWDRLNQKNPDRYLWQNESLQTRILLGSFSDQILEGFRDILDYYGESPIIVRSSSLLEDNYGNAFAGKYDSIFCPNQGTVADRMADFTLAVQRIFAGTMSREALEYRKERGVLGKDEQMALLVQRVSGRRRGRYFFPDLAGTIVSYNAYAWHPDIEPEAGMARIVMGLGTRAVDRVAEDFPWVVSLNAPTRNLDKESHRVRQRTMDALDLEAPNPQNPQGLTEVPLLGNFPEVLELPSFLFEKDWRREREATALGLPSSSVIEPSLNRLFKTTDFAPIFREAAAILRELYSTHVELEFTAQWDHRWDSGNPHPWINVLQCRPFQMRIDQEAPGKLTEPKPNDIILQVSSPVIGRSRHVPIHYVVWVDPTIYAKGHEDDHYRIAKEIGAFIRRLTTAAPSSTCPNVVLLGPGRWGTSTSAMGIPIRFGDIRKVQVLGEMDWMHPDLSPDISLGTHFFHDLVEADMLFVGLRRSDPSLVWKCENETAQSQSLGDSGAIFYRQPQEGEVWWLYADPTQNRAVVYRVAFAESV
ncbi:MAG: hypothetical protein GW949_02690 [Spirochaetales bacterium]|nr:hypothetical protein [Spirochaetales bacterium]